MTEEFFFWFAVLEMAAHDADDLSRNVTAAAERGRHADTLFVKEDRTTARP